MIDSKALFHTAWDEECDKRKEQSPSFDLGDYTITGRAAAAYGGKRNHEWWHDNGPGLVDNYVEWRKRTKWEIWETPTGEHAVELNLNVTLPGDIYVVTYIDRVFVLPSGQIAVLDLKTGRLPETEEQLGFYATAIELTYGAMYRPQWGYYWDAQKGEHGRPLALDRWTPDLFAAMYRQAIDGINAGSFLPKPGQGCGNWCGVSRFCHVVGGAEAIGTDPLAMPTT